MTIKPKLTTKAACRVARIDRNRFNEEVAAGTYNCAPKTIPGRARLFDPDDMIALYLFRELIEDGYTKARAGRVACAVSEAARQNPDSPAITFVESYFGPNSGDAFPAESVPTPDRWVERMFSGSDIRKTTTFNIRKMRELIAHYTAEEAAIIGEDD
ncbi:hypothetical protein [Sedimentitalea todarodis]|uniref:HTH merR-type domain-containing protein n=1 Tax=Sedimentitalea todarodis TaxID=1631240 RepID=A0ABU3VHW3_9RHOB|nr:hypothetical protein [Sedimentitalea todarodis]MDU9005735.1 hypothetical protein [Sedimentitalea todarodis]